MLIGRFLFIIPLLAVAGSLARKKVVPASAGTLPTHGPLFVGLLVGVGDHRRRADVLPGALARSDRRAFPDAQRQALLHAAVPGLELNACCDGTSQQPPPVDTTALLPKKLVRARPLFDPPIVRRAIRDSFVKLNPVTLMKNPVMFVVEVGAALTTVLLVRDIASRRRRISASRCRSRSGSGSRCCSPTSPKRWPKARGKAQADTLRKTKTDTIGQPRCKNGGKSRQVAASQLRAGDVVVCERRRHHSRRRRGDRRHRDASTNR